MLSDSAHKQFFDWESRIKALSFGKESRETDMAANCARRTLQFSSASAKTILSRPPSSPFASNASKLTEFTSLKPASAPRLAAQKLKFSRLPVELGGAQSLIPLHSATASALFTSLLSLHNTSWGCLSEGFATPL
ncbi:hypothetical protein EV2_011969 [Malus domestica]